MYKICQRCLMPDTKPDLYFNAEGVCSACTSFEARSSIDWKLREHQLFQLISQYRSRDGSNWDCIVPVSGGKDSTFQALKMLQMGLRPLCVNATTCALSDVGRRNLDNLKKIGLDVIEVSPNPQVRKKLNRIGLTQVGDISWPEHVSIFTIPIQIAVRYRIPLLIWGENAQNEYGGPAAAAENNILDRKWLEEFGGLLGLRVTDVVGLEGIRREDILPYIYPSDEEIKSVKVTGLFLGYFLPWDGFTTAMVSQNNGWESYPTAVEGSALNYENLDNLFHGIHDYFKFLKFGFGRATDHICMQIRRNRLSREEGFQIQRSRDGKFPWSYLGVPLEKLLSRIDIELDEFIRICDRFTNKKLFKCDSKGHLVKDKNLNLELLTPNLSKSSTSSTSLSLSERFQ